MKIFAISDLHLSFGHNKPMDIFGGNWENYLEKIKADWESNVSDDDIVLIAGDISWAMQLKDTNDDFKFLDTLPGIKVIIRGNHDYWWSGISSVRKALPKNIYALQNDAIKINNYVICGSRGWTVPERYEEQTAEDKKIFDRELIRQEMALSQAKRLANNNEIIIAMIHYPPFDFKKSDSEFTKLYKEYGVSHVIYGHLHGKNVNKTIKYVKDEISYYLTSCDQADNKLIRII